MSFLTTKQAIIDYLIEKTELYGIDHIQSFTTQRISYQLNISRSLTSQYLNELCKEGLLIKVNTRPVYYFYKSILEKRYSTSVKYTEYLNMNDLIEVLFANHQKDLFSDVIGYNTSLYYCISQMKAAMQYPPNGVPIILQGEKNLDKKKLVKTLFLYCQSKGIISKDAHLQIIEVLSSEMANLCDKKVFDNLNGGFLYIENATLLDRNVQRKIAKYLMHISEDYNVKKRPHIILSIEEESYDRLDEKLRMSIPLVCEIPSWRQRTSEEHEQYIIHYFQKEEKRLHCQIRITHNLFYTLRDYEFLGNFHELKNTIRMICMNAWLEHKDNEILDVKSGNLPLSIALSHSSLKQPKAMLNGSFMIDDYKGNDSSKQLLNFFDRLLDSHISFQENHFTFSEFLIQGQILLREYYNYIVFDYHYEEEKIRKMEESVNQILKGVEVQYQINLPLNCSFVLARIINRFLGENNIVYQWENKRQNDISECLNTLMNYLPTEMRIATEMSRSLMNTMDVHLSNVNLIFLILNIQFYNKDIQNQEICGLIVSHGYSTATSIADACNQLLQKHIFKAIDMPLDVQVDQITKQINDFVKLYPYYQSMILMVDMGSLIDIGDLLDVDMEIGVINNISTEIALEVGNEILMHQELEVILQKTCENAKCYYRLIKRERKEKVIVFTSDAGIKVSKRIVKLFQDSLMKPIDLKFMEYDYNALLHNKENDILFKKYEVVLIVKPYTLEIDHIPSLSLEDIIGFVKIEKLHTILSQYLNQEEIEIFNQQLLKNFSLQNIMENLTILNPSLLLDYVSDSINQLQRLMNMNLHSQTIAGIYIHVSFLVERLVTKNAIETHEDLREFEKEHKEFIENVHSSFEAMLKHYNVKLPISEIAYLFDYIEYDMNK